MEKIEYDVIVIGGGIMGSCAAYQSAKRGLRTLLLEQFDFLHHRGSSHGESRTIRAAYTEDHYAKMVLAAELLWREAEAEIGYKVFFKSQQLDMGPADNKVLQAVVSTCRKTSVPVKVLDAKQVMDEFAGRFQLPEDWVGVVTGLGGVIKPTKAVSMFQALAVKHGATMKDNVEVNGVERENLTGGISVTAKSGERFWGKKCVITAGPWIRKLVADITGSRVVLPVQPLETNACYWRIKEGREGDFTIANGFPTFSSHGEPHVYGTPSLEFPGLIKINWQGGRECDAEGRTFAPLPSSLCSMKQWIEERLGGLVDSSAPVMSQSCMYSMTPDEDYVIDFLGGELGKDVVVAGGFSGHGFKMGPLVGQILADLVWSGSAPHDLSHFRIHRFQEAGER
ncbi:probable sarcosine oxidase [Ipomoea triloba]|uniref:probable sarcosine oxidase n=1 Tax=Ipomoea triloba TaxID=35885 RepID=UPI00125D4B8D|nr:probable sarcosine oxidase [Ipomoea triloba]